MNHAPSLAALALLSASGVAQQHDFATDVQPLLERYCYRCHGPEKQKGDVQLDVLDPLLSRRPDAEGWRAALDMINGAEMPPDDEAQPTDEERRVIVSWMTASLKDAAVRFAGERRTVLRRLTKQQYTNTLQDLLSVQIDFGRVLPDDGKSETGFSNNGEVLQASPLHLDYYQQVARQGLEQAIVVGERPDSVRYRVRFGRGIGKGHVAKSTGGYQSVALSTDDFVIDILGADGNPEVAGDDAEQQAFDRIRKKISVGLRGSSQDRFRMVDEGLILYSALPHKEKAPGSWQGPSPNVKLEMQRVFPDVGDLAMRVKASHGYIPPAHKQVLVPLTEPLPMAALEGEVLETKEGAIILDAKKSDQRKNVRLEEGVIRPVDVPAASSVRLRFSVPADGFYQVDLVHPRVEAGQMASVRLTIDNMNIDMRPEPSAEEALERTVSAPTVSARSVSARSVSALGAVSLRAGNHTMKLGGPFFAGFAQAIISPLPPEHPFVQRSTARIEELSAAVADKQPALRGLVGTRTDDGMDYKTFDAPQVVDAAKGDGRIYTFYGRLENLPVPEPESGDTEVLSGFTLIGVWNDHLVKSRRETGPPLLVEYIEVEAPFYETWPPRSHTDIFVVSDHSGDETAYAREIIEHFIARAFRRTPSRSDVDRYFGFWRAVRGDFATFEESIREVLVAVLCSPNFLFLVEPESGDDEVPTSIDEVLATRLSYFLWNSPPDDLLRGRAASGELREGLDGEVDRMLDDPRAERFVRSFAREWLRMDRIENITIDPDRFPAFTRFVKRDLQEETYAFVSELLARDASIFTLIDSDFAMLNQNLAEFYGIDGVAGPHLRPVAIAPDLRRGGLLSQGAFLAGHSDGQWPHPIKRAVWVKKQLLGDEPPPPPPNVPRLDPDEPTTKNLTLKEKLELHRDDASCRDCHRGIDPFGIAFENYNAAGLWEEVRAGKPIDASTELPDGTVVAGVDGLKKWLLEERPGHFARALTEHLFAYALGRDVHFADEEELVEIVEATARDGYRLRALLRHIVTSPSFSKP